MPTRQADKKWLTSYEREALFTASALLINAFFDEYHKVDAWEPETILSTRLGEHLPRHYFPHYTPLFYKQFGTCVITVAWKLAQPKPLPPASVAEQLAAWAILKEAKAFLKRASNDESAGKAEHALQVFADAYFSETGFLLLFDPANDGIRVGPVTPALDQEVAFASWFHPFHGQTQSVHPYAGGAHQVGRAYKTHLTRREQETLATAIAVLIDEIFESIVMGDQSESKDFALTSLSWHLPLHHQSEYSPFFQKQFIVCILTAAWKLAQPRQMALSSIMEELAAWAIMTAAKQQIELDYDIVDYDIEGKAGGEQAARYAFEDLIEVFFEDEDFVLLFDESNEGIDTSSVGRWLHMTSLSFQDWTKPFTDEPVRIAHPFVFP